MKPEALEAFYTANLSFVSDVLKNAGVASLHANRETQMLADLCLAISMWD